MMQSLLSLCVFTQGEVGRVLYLPSPLISHTPSSLTLSLIPFPSSHFFYPLSFSTLLPSLLALLLRISSYFSTLLPSFPAFLLLIFSPLPHLSLYLPSGNISTEDTHNCTFLCAHAGKKTDAPPMDFPRYPHHCSGTGSGQLSLQLLPMYPSSTVTQYLSEVVVCKQIALCRCSPRSTGLWCAWVPSMGLIEG